MAPEAEADAATWAENHAKLVAQYSQVTDRNLAAAAHFAMAKTRPVRFGPGVPLMEATLMHVILPEMIRRLEASKR